MHMRLIRGSPLYRTPRSAAAAVTDDDILQLSAPHRPSILPRGYLVGGDSPSAAQTPLAPGAGEAASPGAGAPPPAGTASSAAAGEGPSQRAVVAELFRKSRHDLSGGQPSGGG